MVVQHVPQDPSSERNWNWNWPPRRDSLETNIQLSTRASNNLGASDRFYARCPAKKFRVHAASSFTTSPSRTSTRLEQASAMLGSWVESKKVVRSSRLISRSNSMT